MSNSKDQEANDEVFDDGIANAGSIIKRGDSVIRPAGKHSAAVHALLRHLADHGFTGAPRAISLGSEHETLSFMKGVVPKPPYEDWVKSDETLFKIAELQRRYHDVVRSFENKPEYSWNVDLSDPLRIGPVSHNDLGPGNVVFENRIPTGMIDFDFAAPSRVIWDVARTIRVWAPLDDPDSAESYGLGGLNPFTRLKVFCDGFKLGKQERAELSLLLEECNTVSVAYVRQQYEAGKPSFVKIWSEYNLGELYARRANWMQENRTELNNSLT